MKTDTPKTIHLKDYRPPDFLIDEVFLDITLGEEATRIAARLSMRRNPAAESPDAPLVLDGEHLETERVAIDGVDLDSSAFTVSENKLTLAALPPNAFTLETTVLIKPQENTALEGIYKSDGIFCSQCEAEGFRRITWYLDRPDVLARFKTRITGNVKSYPVLLSNGNCIETETHDDGIHSALWEDPHPKPSYLFALVAGDLGCLEDSFTTASGREVVVQIFVEHGKEPRARHAMDSLINAMKWDEEVFGLEYDLDIYMIVAVSAFNMGAMENKGLNLFNDKYVLADPETATDMDYVLIEAVIAHEYFHNWTGNRVTCRDWFQLSLKEGLTVFRDQQFSADMRSAAVQRIGDVRALRARQFPEDSGPLAHPIRPDSYIEINNFYTATVYEKGAEVIRMMHALLGADGFRKGIDLYFERHDGQAVTCDDFVAAMEDAGDTDLGHFRRWYSQAGTPTLNADGRYEEVSHRYTLTLTQETAPTPGQPEKSPLHIPVRFALMDTEGKELRLGADGETERVLHLTEPEQSFVFDEIQNPPVASLLRGFSAPVKLKWQERSADEYAFQMTHDSDAFNRWEAGQNFAKRLVTRALETGAANQTLTDAFAKALASTLEDTATDPALVGEMLALPSEADLAEQQVVIDVDAIHEAREEIRIRIAAQLTEQLIDTYERCTIAEPYHHGPEQSGKRRLRNVALSYLTALDDDEAIALAKAQFDDAANMTDSIGALVALNDCDTPVRSEALSAFYDRWQGDALVIDKWFTLQATSTRPDTLTRINELMDHEAFSMTTPNRVRALIGAFCSSNQLKFHNGDGSGYEFLADRVVELNGINPQIAARLLTPLSRWRRFDSDRQALMKACLERVLATPELSRDVFEIASKTLESD
ncbi:MAG TPA: aminopeptidase N [Rhodospirillaceae bacterium]|nr:aminopeptidase N [Rhodospirillaceae bacterium]HAT36313.1 aminopeptidase N [Rhodospirillaceae bacterium]